MTSIRTLCSLRPGSRAPQQLKQTQRRVLEAQTPQQVRLRLPACSNPMIGTQLQQQLIWTAWRPQQGISQLQQGSLCSRSSLLPACLLHRLQASPLAPQVQSIWEPQFWQCPLQARRRQLARLQLHTQLHPCSHWLSPQQRARCQRLGGLWSSPHLSAQPSPCSLWHMWQQRAWPLLLAARPRLPHGISPQPCMPGLPWPHMLLLQGQPQWDSHWQQSLGRQAASPLQPGCSSMRQPEYSTRQQVKRLPQGEADPQPWAQPGPQQGLPCLQQQLSLPWCPRTCGALWTSWWPSSRCARAPRGAAVKKLAVKLPGSWRPHLWGSPRCAPHAE